MKYKLSDWMWALTLRQPVASAVIDGHKTLETRNFHPGKVTEFALHTGKSDLPEFQGVLERLVPDWPALERLPHGVVLGVVKIVAVYDLPDDYIQTISDLDFRLGYWKSEYAWQLGIVEVFDEPVAARGLLGFWKWYPEAEARKRPGGPDWLKSLDGRISPDGTTFID